MKKDVLDADCVIIGAGAGASTAAGIEYGGKRFADNFAEFIEKYGGYYMTDMYAAGFYPYPSEEAKWGYWSKHAWMNRFAPPALLLYIELYDMVKNKEYFVLTTNVDHQFYKAGFVHLNKDEAVVSESFGKRAIGIGADMAKAIADIRRSVA